MVFGSLLEFGGLSLNAVSLWPWLTGAARTPASLYTCRVYTCRTERQDLGRTERDPLISVKFRGARASVSVVSASEARAVVCRSHEGDFKQRRVTQEAAKPPDGWTGVWKERKKSVPFAILHCFPSFFHDLLIKFCENS